MNGCHWAVDSSGIAVITLDRSPVNCLDPTLVTTLHLGLDAIELSAARVLIVQSAGGPVFCAGADLRFVEQCIDDGPDGHRRMLDFVRGVQFLCSRIEALPLPTIAVLDGAATGGGFELALSCDIRIATAAARVGLPEVAIGLIPGAGGTQRLTRLVGPGAAAAMILGARLLRGNEAHALGLVQQVADEQHVRQVAHELALSLAGRSPAAIASAKRCIALACSPAGYMAELECTAQLLNEPTTISMIRDFLAGRSLRSTSR